jgi:acetolactate synthase-1/2/3 large subunit
MRFDDRVTGNLDTYAKQAKIIHFDIDPAEINKNVKADIAVLGDSKVTLDLLLPMIKANSHESWHNEFKEKHKIEFEQIIKNDVYPTKEKLTMAEVIEEINIASGHRAIIVSDVGQHQMIACRYAKFKQTKSNVTSGGLGTMGFALPAAIGAKMGAMDREVVAIIGDGGYQMTIQELGTIFQNKTPVKIVVLNNDHLGMVRQWQELFFQSRYASTVMVNPDFVKIAEGYHIESKRISERKDLKATIKEMLASKEAYFLEVKVEKEDNVFPMIPSGASVSDIRLK